MIEAIMSSVIEILKIMGWIGIVMLLLTVVNTVCMTVYNITEKGESFSFKKLFSGLGRTLLFYICAAFVAVAFTIIPFLNTMIAEAFGAVLINEEILSALSGVGVLGVCITTIIAQGKKAIEGILKLGEVKSRVEEITWEVVEEEEEKEK